MGTKLSTQQEQNETAAPEHTAKTPDRPTQKAFDQLISLGFAEEKIRKALNIYEVSLYILTPNLQNIKDRNYAIFLLSTAIKSEKTWTELQCGRHCRHHIQSPRRG